MVDAFHKSSESLTNFENKAIDCKLGTIILREAKMKDAKDLNKIFNDEKVKKYLIANKKSSLSKTKKIMKEVLQNENKNRIVAEYKKKVIGFIGIERGFDKSNHILSFHIMVDSKFHGMGVGTALMKSIFGYCKGNGIKRIESGGGILEDNKNGLRFYKKLGFNVEGIQRNRYCKENKFINGIMIAKLF